MDKKDTLNIILFLVICVLIIIIGQIGISRIQTQWDGILINIGVSMLAGFVCGFFLFGIKDIIRDKQINLSKSFIRVDLNKEMGTQYWLDLIKYFDQDSSSLWFVGSKHITWIEKGLPYKRPLMEKLQSRVGKYNKKKPSTGFEVYIIISNEMAFNEWKKLIIEIAQSTNYFGSRPELIQLGLVDEQFIKYSIVANGKRMIVIPYISEGRSDFSPTIEIQSCTELSQIYFDDLEIIKTKGNFWYYGKPE